MKINETTIFVFIASIVLGLMVSLNISFRGTGSMVVLSARQYQEAINERSKLYKEVSDLQDQYNLNNDKLDNYKNGDPTGSKIISEIQDEMKQNSLLLGTAEAQGEGLKITLNDATMEFDGEIDDPLTRWLRLVHNTDVLFVINSLKNAGIEAMAINGQRIMSTSEVYCSGPFLSINGIKLSAPFYINAIGNKEVLKNYMMGEDGYIKTLIYRGINVEVDTSTEVKIPAYVGQVNYKFMSEANN